ncbi:uncharacterized protein K02A2.6-like [Sabethes cyaneus]|uniref:uncharacterized protein K02A2.6-like n=1 Tax=Sabethes cyaneus TaxID=53552 RepID=UPI00237DCBF6|nr:uncharacterized protein K02A2.6-like [Sabethes cyaneus]
MEPKPSLKPFDVSDTTSIVTRWTKWKRSLELFLDVNCIALASRKRSYLLHYAGPDVQDIFYNIDGHDANPPAGSNVYTEAIRLLDAHFAPLSNIPYERFVFRQMAQEQKENIEQFIQRLRDQGKLCEYGAALEIRITEQVFDKCNLDDLREAILKKRLMTVQAIAEEGRSYETVKKNREEMKKPVAENMVNAIGKPGREVCFRCGNVGHYANDRKCPAKSKVCDKCNLMGHFRKMCKTKRQQKASFNRASGGNSTKKQIRQVKSTGNQSTESDTESSSDDDVQNVYAVNSVSGKVTCFVGGVKMDWVIDSGAHANVISKRTWKWLKSQGCVVSREEKSNKSLRVYGDGKLEVYKTVKADIATGKKTVHHEICVVDVRKGANLLSRQTSMELGILKISAEVFNVSEAKEMPIGKLKNVQVEIKVDRSITPIQQACRRLPIPLKEMVDRKIADLLEQDIIEPAPLNITWASPLVVTPKDGGKSVRLCVDMRKVNQAIIPQKHPLPTFDEIVPHLNGCKVFSKIDLVKAFHQIELAPNSRNITTFVTPDAYYRYKRLMFGMSVAAEVFQRCIERVLKGLKGVKVFIDDMLVYGSSQKEHDINLQAVLNRLKEQGLTINEEKCEFGKRSVVFMGHTLSENGILPTEEKVSAIQSFRRPQNATELRSFLGLANYVGRFIPNLSTVTAPLRAMTTKGTKFRWSKEAKRAFTEVKRALTDPQHLAFYNPQYKTTLVTDASENGLGAVLLQTFKSVTRPVCYASKSLSKTEKKYSTLDKEALAIVWATEHFDMYLRGLEFTILTDHKPLVHIFGDSSTLNQRQERWILRMQAYRQKVVYVPGEINIADPLSRLCETTVKTFDKAAEEILCSIVETNKPVALTMSEIIRSSQEDQVIQKIRRALHNDSWEDVIKGYAPFSAELCFANEVLLRKNKIVIPQSLHQTVLQLTHVGHPGKEKMKRRIREAVWWPGVDAAVEKFCRNCIDCQMVGQKNKPEPLRIKELPSAPWVHLSMDFLGPLPNGKYIFVLVDLYSRFVIAEFMTRTTSTEVIRFLKQLFTRTGLPFVLTADNAKNFSSQELKDYCVDFGVKLTHTTPYWPSANGEVERQNRSLLKVLKISQQNESNLENALQEYLYMYSLTPHSITGIPPATLMYGRRFRDLIPNMQHELLFDDEMRDRDLAAKYHAKEYRDKRVGAQESSLKVGDGVLVKNMQPQNKLTPAFLATPATVIDRYSNTATVETAEGQKYKRNVSHLKRIETPGTAEKSASFNNTKSPEPSDNFQEHSANSQTTGHDRPRREVLYPKRFDDYILE